MRIYLIGFMGAGKTEVGRRLAERLGIPFVDLDGEIELQTEMKVRQIFESRGEPAFRSLEQEVLRRVSAVAETPGAVIATGGGTFAHEANARLIRAHGLSVFLNPSFGTIVQRIGGLGKADRPLFKDETQAMALYRERLPAYRRADLTIDIAPDESPDEVAARIALRVGSGGRS